ncbi:hypothetical protein CPAR01_11732 [Colletotrichum paranaense]|uniref:Uncharacterized protein n=1 Tax=Colletotrichum paranaense TaxID=1914294 RepID=A0ABQ9S832_9PEZI|nr:uncharacterized protein CPAR01_11732 [Colletotrichum paranaense]KAK1529420.1 hypothetical protein CPAR01_11732 [Colletotrichum paranaense]
MSRFSTPRRLSVSCHYHDPHGSCGCHKRGRGHELPGPRAGLDVSQGSSISTVVAFLCRIDEMQALYSKITLARGPSCLPWGSFLPMFSFPYTLHPPRRARQEGEDEHQGFGQQIEPCVCRTRFSGFRRSHIAGFGLTKSMLRTLATNTVIVNENDKGAQAQNGLGRAVLVRRGSVGREAGTAGREDASDLKTRAKHRPVGLVFCPPRAQDCYTDHHHA